MLGLLTIPVVATSYCDTGRTATGTYASLGTAAVDPRFIPLHSRLRIVASHAGAWMERFVRNHAPSAIYRAEDTGGDIRGARIDIWQPSCAQALAWGRRAVTVSILPESDASRAQRARPRRRRRRWLP